MERPDELGDGPMPETRRIAAWEPIDKLALTFLLLIVAVPALMTMLPDHLVRGSHPRLHRLAGHRKA